MIFIITLSKQHQNTWTTSLSPNRRRSNCRLVESIGRMADEREIGPLHIIMFHQCPNNVQQYMDKRNRRRNCNDKTMLNNYYNCLELHYTYLYYDHRKRTIRLCPNHRYRCRFLDAMFAIGPAATIVRRRCMLTPIDAVQLNGSTEEGRCSFCCLLVFVYNSTSLGSPRPRVSPFRMPSLGRIHTGSGSVPDYSEPYASGRLSVGFAFTLQTTDPTRTVRVHFAVYTSSHFALWLQLLLK